MRSAEHPVLTEHLVLEQENLTRSLFRKLSWKINQPLEVVLSFPGYVSGTTVYAMKQQQKLAIFCLHTSRISNL